MAPNEEAGLSEETLEGRRASHPAPGDEVCITGIDGLFPESVGMHEFRDNLLSGRDLITYNDRRWSRAEVLPDLPWGNGKISGFEKFDSVFFGIPAQEAEALDPAMRKLMEATYGAIVDAGMNPAELRGSSTSIYVATCYSPSDSMLCSPLKMPGKIVAFSCSRMTMAQRIAYWLRLIGPAIVLDTACSSSMYALEQAFKDIRNGRVEQAIVAGVSPRQIYNVTTQFFLLGMLSRNCHCKSFDIDGDGYTRAETVCAILLQKKKNSRRIYATVRHTKTNNDGFKDDGITFPSRHIQGRLLADFYRECQIDPATLSWVESHGTGTPVGDPEECAALVASLCVGRDKPLLIGAVKSNMGHAEPASGIASIAKVVVAMETGLIPPNLNFKQANPNIPGLVDGTLQVVTSALPWDGGLVGVNSFGFGGSNAHICLEWNTKAKVDGGAPRDKLPRLVAVSGRTKESVDRALADLESRPVDAELVRLYHSVYAQQVEGHVFRGYAILQPAKVIRHIVQCFDKRPVWVLFPAPTARWQGFAHALLEIPPFSSAVDACHSALAPTGLQLRQILEQSALDDPLHCAVARTAVQVCLAAVLRSVGVRPNGVLGVEAGELAAGLLDGCFSPEQAVLATYYQAVALYGQPSVRKPVGTPKNRDAGDILADLTNSLGQVLPSPKTRSAQWLSSKSGPPHHVGSVRLASAEFVSQCLLDPGQLETAVRLVPANAVLFVLASDTEMRAALKGVQRRAPSVALGDGRRDDSVEMLLTALGSMFEVGTELQLDNLYPPVAFPVSRGTPMIAPHVRWMHDRDLFVDCHRAHLDAIKKEKVFIINVEKRKDKFYMGHVIDGRNLFPATGYLLIVKQCLAPDFRNRKVVFEDVRFLRATTIPSTGTLRLQVSLQKVSGLFEVVEGGVPVVTGSVFYARDDDDEDDKDLILPDDDDNEGIEMVTKDIYKEMRLRGYDYTGLFRGLVSINSTAERGKIRWERNWVAFMDNMLQMQILAIDKRGLFVPTCIERLTIDQAKHKILVGEGNLSQMATHEIVVGDAKLSQQATVLDVTFNKMAGVIRSGGIMMRGLSAAPINRKRYMADPIIEKYLFLANTNEAVEEPKLSVHEALRACVHVCLENRSSTLLKVVELADSKTSRQIGLLAPQLSRILGDLPLMRAEITVLASSEESALTDTLDPQGIKVENAQLSAQNGCAFVLGSQLLRRPDVLAAALNALDDQGFIVAVESPDEQLDAADSTLDLLNEYHVMGGKGVKLILLRKKRVVTTPPVVVWMREGQDEAWIGELQAALKEGAGKPRRVLLVAQGEPTNGALGAFNCLRKEPSADLARLVLVLDETAPPFDLDLPLYRDQLAKDLAVNVLKDGRWGSFRHLPLESSAEVDTQHAYANVDTYGDLSSFRWLAGPHNTSSSCVGPNEQLVHVYFSALNFKDVMIASGRLSTEVFSFPGVPQDCFLGCEFAGRTESGRRVMGIVVTAGFSSLVVAEKDLMWEIPDEWSLEEAATVPIAYCTAMLALYEKGGMKRGDSVLIHAGSGAVGLAAIQLALHTGATVFTTVGTPEKRAFLKQRFPALSDRQIGNTRDSSFEQLVMTETGGRGVDMVLNSLAEEKLQASLRCLAVGGRFLEIGKFDLASNHHIGMEFFLRETSFHGVMLDLMFGSKESKKPLQELLARGIRAGAVKPLVSTVFPAEQVEQAFRFMGHGKHVGKVLLSLRPEEPQKRLVPKTILRKATPRFLCDPHGSYIVAGGLGGFGLELANWLVLRGARHLVLVSRSGVRTGYQSSRVRVWRSYGVAVLVSTCNIDTEKGVLDLLAAANRMGPVAAIFNLAVVLRDAMFENQTVENFAAVAGPKAVATRLLDATSRRLCPHLKHFVVFSSISCGRGNAGQTSYGAANSVMERICELRAHQGLPALAVQWGAVGQVGLVADMRDDDQEVVIGGTLPQSISSCLAALDGFLIQKHPVVASMVVAEKKVGTAGTLLERVAEILGIKDLKTISTQRTLAELGMDSMTGVEIKQTMEREFQVFLTPQEIRVLTMERVAELSEGGAPSLQVDPSEQEMDVEMLLNMLGEERDAYLETVHLPSLHPSNAYAIPTLIAIPGLERVAIMLEPLAKNLNAKVVCLLGDLATDKSETIEDMARNLLPLASAQLAPGAPFLLLGYSFGALLALRLAALLEAEGRKGKLFLIDGAPEYFQSMLKKNLSSDSEDDLQAFLLVSVANVAFKLDRSGSEKMYASLLAKSSWEERLKHVIAEIPTKAITERYFTDITNSMLRRVKAVMKFTWGAETPLLASPVKLLRPEYKALKLQLDLDFGLGKFCQHPVEVQLFDETHKSIIGSTQVAQIINDDLKKTT